MDVRHHLFTGGELDAGLGLRAGVALGAVGVEEGSQVRRASVDTDSVSATALTAVEGGQAESESVDHPIGVKRSDTVGLPFSNLVSEGEIQRRLGLCEAWVNSFGGNREAKNFQAILMIFGAAYTDGLDGKSAGMQKWEALIAQVELAKTNAPPRLARCFGKARSPQTQEGYQALERILTSQ